MNTKKKITAVAAVVLALCLMIGGTIAFIKTNTQTLRNTFTYGAVRLLLNEANLKTPDTTDRTETGNAYVLEQGKEYIKDPTVTVEKGSEPCYVRMLVRVDLKQFNTEQLKQALENYKTTLGTEKVAGIVTALTNAGWLVADNTEPTNPKLKLNTDKIIEYYLVGWDDEVWVHSGTYYAAQSSDPTAGDDKTKGVAEYRYHDKTNNTDIVDASAADVKLDALFTSFKVPQDEDFPNLPDGVTPMGLIEGLIAELNKLGDPNTTYTLNDLIPDICIVAQAVSVSDFADAAAAFDAAGEPEGFAEGTQLHIPTIPVTTPTAP